MITINLDPTLLTWGALHVRWFALTTLVAITLGVLVAGREAGRRGIAVDEVYSAAIWALLAGAIGARLVHVLGRFDDFRRAPMAILALQEGGLSMYGALIGGGIALAAYGGVRRLGLGDLLDAAAPGLLVGQAFGRIGDLLTGSAQGTLTTLPWSIAYTNRNSLAPILGVYGHPYPVYEMLWNLLVLGALVAVRRRMPAAGTLFLLYAAFYSAGRLGLDFFRTEPIVWLGLQQAQMLAAVVLLCSVLLLARRWILASRAGRRRRAAVLSDG